MDSIISQQPKVSVICKTFNHEKYIKKCLDGLISQKTSFPFEVIVHDDASTDKTASIIREYERKYPNLVKPIYQSENQYSKNIDSTCDYIIPRAKGTFIAICEGDDYWCSPYKLQKQVDILENHPDCKICVHRVNLINEKGEQISGSFPETDLQTGILKPKDFFYLHYLYGYLFQTSSYLVNGDIFREYIKNPPKFKRICYVGDAPIQYYFISLGCIYYIDEPLSCYRRFSIGGWTRKLLDDKKAQLNVLKNRIETLYEYDQFTKENYHEDIQRLIDRYNFLIALKQNDYKICLSAKYTSILHQFCSFRMRMSLRLRYYFPTISKIFQFIKDI